MNLRIFKQLLSTVRAEDRPSVLVVRHSPFAIRRDRWSIVAITTCQHLMLLDEPYWLADFKIMCVPVNDTRATQPCPPTHSSQRIVYVENLVGDFRKVNKTIHTYHLDMLGVCNGKRCRFGYLAFYLRNFALSFWNECNINSLASGLVA